MTDLEEERKEQSRWRLRPNHAGLDVFDRLVAAEFLPPERQQAVNDTRLKNVVRFAVQQVPYYRDLFARLGLTADDVPTAAALPAVPPLTKRDVYDHNDRLRAEALPKGHKVIGVFNSSGTTGRPARVVHTVASNTMFGVLAQRQLRWFRWDPAGTAATIRLASQLPPAGPDKPNPDGQTQTLPAWRYVGHFFHTGPAINFNLTNPIEAQLDWLDQNRPDYLMSYSESLLHLVLAKAGGNPSPGVRGLFAISEQLTPSMRRMIERACEAPVDQCYGLNEVGLTAVRCGAGRYHAHAEHCLIEIADDDGRPCTPGATGRILVTAFNNAAMPLLRYDTGDMAVAVEGPCPCGRALPSFGDIVGRYSRIVCLPEGTMRYVGAVREALETMPPEIIANLRQFRIHQYRDNRFELRVHSVRDLPPRFSERIMRRWTAVVGDAGHSLTIVPVDYIPRSPGGKSQDFTSDFMPQPGDDDGIR